MVLSLENLSFMAIAHRLFENDKFPGQVRCRKFQEHMDELKLPKKLEWQLKLAIFELLRRKTAKHYIQMSVGLTGAISHDKRTRLKSYLRHFYSEPQKWIGWPPAISEHFPETDSRRTAMKLLFCLLVPNPANDDDGRNPILECWTDEAFIPFQSSFLNNFGKIWYNVSEYAIASVFIRFPYWDIPTEATAVITELFRCSAFQSYLRFGNLPWFIFEVLNIDQKNKFLTRGPTGIVARSPDAFKGFFATIFCHWPWYDESYNIYFATKTELSYIDMALWQDVMSYKRGDEQEMAGLGVFYRL